jgi:hypothetical protein
MSLVSYATSVGKLAAGALTILAPLGCGIAIPLSDSLAASIVMACVAVGAGFLGLGIFCSLDTHEAVEHDRRLRRAEG